MSKTVSIFAWGAALLLVACALFLGWRILGSRPSLANSSPGLSSISGSAGAPLQPARTNLGEKGVQVALPTLPPPTPEDLALLRRTNLHTIFPNRPDEAVITYTVSPGDSVFGIATAFKLKPETILWANYGQLNDNPDLVSLGMVLNIPPVNGVLYTWQEGDTLESVAGRFEAKPEDILNWLGNHLDLTNPQVAPGTLVMVPGGHREFRQWIIPTIPRGRAGVSSALYGAGTCEGGYSGANGTGGFIWPAGNHVLSGNDYWSGHLAIDIGAGEGAPIYASDSGVVVFAGWALGGYGNMVMIDHGNGYQTLYAHLSSVSVSCGRSVGQGAVIGYAGSTGNSTGAHLHFEVRYQGGFTNPWYVLPAP